MNGNPSRKVKTQPDRIALIHELIFLLPHPERGLFEQKYHLNLSTHPAIQVTIYTVQSFLPFLRCAMSANQRISQVFQQAHQIPFDDDSRFVLFSDCHRGDNSWADDFASNQSLLFHALEHYYAEGFSYIEVGDGDELWENSKFEDIRQAHSHIFWVMRKFHENQRLFLIYGNHDMERSDPKIVDETLQYYYDERTGQVQPLFVNIQVYEGIILKHVVNERQLFILHGHQADPFNDRYWKIGRFIARHFWRHLQLLGVKEPTSPAKNFKKRVQIENTLNN